MLDAGCWLWLLGVACWVLARCSGLGAQCWVVHLRAVKCWVMGARKQVARKVGKGIGW